MVSSTILTLFLVLNVGFALGKHNELKTGKHNFWVSLVVVIINAILYYYAGVFNNFM